MPGPNSSKDVRIPFDKLPGEMSKDQCEVILSLVSIAENGSTEWWKNYNYCEDIGDGRGVTVSLVGFCSGTHDLLWVFRSLAELNSKHPLLKYIPALERSNKTSSTLGLEHLGTDLCRFGDDAWRQAVWKGILYHYWDPAMKFAATMGCTRAITKGFLYDIALNHGAGEMERIARRVRSLSPRAGGDEVSWLKDLIDVRRIVITKEDRTTNNGQPDRCDLWNGVLANGNLDLKRPLRNLTCYKTSFSIK